MTKRLQTLSGRTTRPTPLAVLLAATLTVGTLLAIAGSRSVSSELRRTAEVKAVEKARPSVVNIRGHKTVRSDENAAQAREVNGMGTGVVIDQRGYIITNFHVVDNVRQIEVTLHDGTMLPGRLISSDPKTDLAIIKIDPKGKLQTVDFGTSADLMPAEPVIAVGNAYGYEHTITRGIVSALHRNVQVSDSQSYNDLIQTDASINPGNSGGPLLNIDGEMIGINVAVRAGAQGIGFAIPVDNAMLIIARLMSVEKINQTWHGLAVKDAVRGKSGVTVDKIADQSPAQKAELKSGDVLKKIGEQEIGRSLDVERALLAAKAGENVDVTVERDGKQVELKLALDRLAAKPKSVAERLWEQLGVKFTAVAPDEVRERRTRYNGGLKVTEVRTDSPARRQGIRTGDILVGMHVWETVSLENVEYVLTRPELSEIAPVKFYIVRDGETLAGRLPVDSVVK